MTPDQYKPKCDLQLVDNISWIHKNTFSFFQLLYTTAGGNELMYGQYDPWWTKAFIPEKMSGLK